MKTLSIIIPVYNEEKTIHHLLDKVKDVVLINAIQKEIIIINNCSEDTTEEVIQKYMEQHRDINISYYKHEINKWKWASVHTGISKVTGDYVIIQDADLEYDPQEYNLLLQPVEDGFADVVYGSRFMSAKPHRILFFWHTFGNKLLTFLSNMFSNLSLSDMGTCYKLFKSEIIKNIPLYECHFGFDTEISQKIGRNKHIRLYEVGISYYGRTYAEGKKIGWKDWFRSLYCMMKYWLFNAK